MRVNITCDADWEAKIDKVLDHFSDLGYRSFFEERNYGSSLLGVTIVLMCQDPKLNLKQRIKQSKKEKKVYIDIMLNLNQMKNISQEVRNKIVSNKIIEDVPSILSKYKFPDFELARFEEDLNEIFKIN